MGVRVKPAPQIVPEIRPYNGDALIQAQIKEMEELGEEMHQDILKHQRSR